MASTRALERLQLGMGAVFSPSRAAELLPGDDTANLREIRRLKLVRRWNGRDVVLWGELVALIAGPPAPDAEPPAPQRRRKARKPL